MKLSRKITIILIAQCLLMGGFSSVHAFSWRSLFGSEKKEEKREEAPGAAIQKQLDASIAQAKSSFGGSKSDNRQLFSALDAIKSSAGAGNDMAMLNGLSGLMGGGGGGSAAAAMMSPAQKNILDEVKGHAQALALTRSFSDDPSMQGPVTGAISAIQNKDPIAAATNLKTISDSARLSPLQRMVVGSLMGDYAKYLDHIDRAADAVDSVNQMIPAGLRR